MSDSCPECRQYLINQLARLLAGGAATARLLSEEHSEAQSRDDQAEVRRLLKKFTNKEELRQKLTDLARQRAGEFVVREARAIQALSSALLQCGVLDGPEAEKIVKENLTCVL